MSELLKELYKKVYLIRKTEETIREYYHEDEMKTPMHMSLGEEGIVAGVCQALTADDQVFGTFRSHALYLSKTGETDKFFAELYGKATGMAKGKSGSMHLSSPEHGFIGASAIVASGIPVAVGAAFANKQSKNGKVVAAFFGDGAVEEGVFWESLNVACLMNLPIVFVCEDNGLAVHIPDAERKGYSSIAEIVSRYNCHVIKSETTDAEKIYKLAREALKLIEETGKPVFMQLKYYRYLEHVGVNEDFNAGYREIKDYQEWRKKDPVDLLRKKLAENGRLESEIEELERSIDQQVRNSLQAAKQADFAAEYELCEDVFA